MLLLGLLLGLCTPAAGFCRLMTAIADHLPRGWRQPLRCFRVSGQLLGGPRHVNSIFCAQAHTSRVCIELRNQRISPSRRTIYSPWTQGAERRG